MTNGNIILFKLQETAPDYDLTKVTVPVYLYHEKYGYLISEANMQFLKEKLPNAVRVPLAVDNWNHISFLYSTDSGIFFKQLIAKIIEDTAA